ncbi:acyl-CoA dehydrogenase family protein [Paraliomyxa miuraensis]|uniref:acyl-CoA dehydrogenase family protein n=1 Tax=Paraliomyxa miuraensis TaxID=376150 RepID=UPI002258B8DD|nr:acyl-CoA dehydrogenase family protein [Paraliomyxa miuraensis]MCX4245333.1 acyl-CoA dehydrogenase family protein [Paraliomyxa miuraensis]
MPAPRSPYYTEDHEALRSTVRRFVEREVVPHIDQWERDGALPRALYLAAGEIGLLGLGFPEEYGGTPGDQFAQFVATEELCRAGSGGLVASLMSHGIGMPPVARLGSPQLKAQVLPPVLRGEKIAALAITEPSGGSDVANLRTRARLDGDHWVVDGSKTLITSGMQADYITTAVRTGGEGMEGVSLLVIPGDAPGLSRTPLQKMGWWCSDTATLYFEDCRVPVGNLVGMVNQGFAAIMSNFNGERLGIAAVAIGMAQVCYDEAVAYARQRETFGRPLITRQVIRHKLVDMAQDIGATRAYLEAIAWRVDRGQWPIAEVCMLKNQATQCLEHCAKEAVQILGGAGYVLGAKVERIYRETKVLSIGGGAEEIMKDLASRQLGL